jgi:membrane-associated phospholipid phosphatase
VPRRARYALGGAAAGVALLFIIWFAAFHIGVVQRADQAIFRGFIDLDQRPRVDGIASFIANLCDPNPFVWLGTIPVLVALARRRLAVALAIAGILLGANETTQLLKPLLAQPRADWLLGGTASVAPDSWPSGHATAAMSLALCFVLAAPSRLRPLAAALGAAFAASVSYSFLTLGWHYPSDVFGGFLVAGTWTALSVAALSALDARRRQPRARSEARRAPVRTALGAPAVALLGALALAALVALAALIALAGPHAVVIHTRAHEAFLIGAAAIGALGVALASGVVLALRR